MTIHIFKSYLLHVSHAHCRIIVLNLFRFAFFIEHIRDRPFNLKGGGLWFFVSFRMFFSDKTRVRIFFFVAIYFPEFNIRLYDKNSESDYFFFLHQNQNISFSNIGNQNIFFRKKTITPLQVKWSFPNHYATSFFLNKNNKDIAHFTFILKLRQKKFKFEPHFPPNQFDSKAVTLIESDKKTLI